jgi:hypothetical protein
MISSPCTKICTIDQASRLCMGCGRSLDEIARWGGMSEAQRLDIMRGLPDRMRAAGLKPQEPRS